jgi:acetylornithine/succinyldiaminopimelate/putrescine aminotransferase
MGGLLGPLGDSISRSILLEPLSLRESMSTDPESLGGFGPYLDLVGPYYTERDGSQRMIRFGEIADLERALEFHGTNVAAFLVEPIQGEAGYVFMNTRFIFCLH